MNSYQKIDVKMKVAEMSYDMASTRAFVRALTLADDIDENKASIGAQRCIKKLEKVKMDLKYLRKQLIFLL